MSYGDLVGDGKGAPDIGNVTLANDAAGTIVFRITTDQPTRPPEAGVYIYIDADRNQGTGGLNDGIEYALGLDVSGFGIVRITSAGTMAVRAAGANATWQDGVVTFTVNRRDLGGTSGFNFFVASGMVSSPAIMRDDAPKAT